MRFQQLLGFAFSIETLGLLVFRNVTLKNCHFVGFWKCNIKKLKPHIYEKIGKMLSTCLIRTTESDDPFIFMIELRPLQDGMCTYAKPGTTLHLIRTIDVGGKSDVK
jgi:hypothetical protein